MLKKLLKYEFKATGRILLPLYMLLIVITIINKISSSISLFNTQSPIVDNDILTIFGGTAKTIVMMTYIIAMVAVFIVTFFIIVQRFYKNLLGDEGYLMNTLPAKATENINCKIISGIAWGFVSSLVAGISIIIMGCNNGLFYSLYRVYRTVFVDIFKEDAAYMYIIIVLIIIATVIRTLCEIIMIYSSMSIGHLFNKRKILASFGAYIILYIAINTILQIISVIIVGLLNIDTAPDKSIIILILIVFIIFYSICFSLFYILTRYILKNKLNLE